MSTREQKALSIAIVVVDDLNELFANSKNYRTDSVTYSYSRYDRVELRYTSNDVSIVFLDKVLWNCRDSSEDTYKDVCTLTNLIKLRLKNTKQDTTTLISFGIV
jgi:hypothetical protein